MRHPPMACRDASGSASLGTCPTLFPDQPEATPAVLAAGMSSLQPTSLRRSWTCLFSKRHDLPKPTRPFWCGKFRELPRTYLKVGFCIHRIQPALSTMLSAAAALLAASDVVSKTRHWPHEKNPTINSPTPWSSPFPCRTSGVSLSDI